MTTLQESIPADWANKEFAPTSTGVPIWNYSKRTAFADKSNERFRRISQAWNANAPFRSEGGARSRWTFHCFSRNGKMVSLVKQSKAKTLPEFNQWYFQNAWATENGGRKLELITWDVVCRYGREFFEWAQANGFNDITEEEALNNHIIHIFDETWRGQRGEESTLGRIEELTGGKLAHADDKWDHDFAIDLVLEDPTAPDGWTVGYQVKTAGFFRGTKASNPGLWGDRQANIQKHKKAEELGKKPYFVDQDDLKRTGRLNLIHHSDIKN